MNSYRKQRRNKSRRTKTRKGGAIKTYEENLRLCVRNKNDTIKCENLAKKYDFTKSIFGTSRKEFLNPKGNTFKQVEYKPNKYKYFVEGKQLNLDSDISLKLFWCKQIGSRIIWDGENMRLKPTPLTFEEVDKAYNSTFIINSMKQLPLVEEETINKIYLGETV